MPNEALRSAMAGARLTTDALAVRLEVDPKTVDRWVAGGRVPHARHRFAAAEALGVDAEVLWPQAIRETIKTGADREIVTAYPHRSSMPRSLWRELITGAAQTLLFAGYTSYFLWLDIPNLRAILKRKVESGASVQFLLGDPDSPVTAERERVEAAALTVSTRIRVTLDHLARVGAPVDVRLTDRHISSSVWRFDHEMIFCTHLADLLGHDSPTFHLKRRAADGLFDRYGEHAAYLWDTARPLDGP